MNAGCDRASFADFHESPTTSLLACIVCKWKDRDTVARTVPSLLRADASVAIYTHDNSSSRYMQRYEWMRRLAHWRDTPAFKNKLFTCLQNLPLGQGRYSHVWFLDADLLLPPHEELQRFFRDVTAYGGAITQPSVLHSDHTFVQRDRSCHARRTNFVEVQAPVIRVGALRALATILPAGNASDWGVDMMWCEYLRRAVNATCVIINANVAHPKRTLPRAYSLEAAHAAVHCLRRRYAPFFAEQRTLGCLT